MERALDRLLIVNDLRDFALRIAAVAERIGMATRVLPHALDLEYVVQNWRPDGVAVQVAMAFRQDIEVLEILESARYSGPLLLTGNVPEWSLRQAAARTARDHGLTVATVLTASSITSVIEDALRLLRGLERAA